MNGKDHMLFRCCFALEDVLRLPCIVKARAFLGQTRRHSPHLMHSGLFGEAQGFTFIAHAF